MNAIGRDLSHHNAITDMRALLAASDFLIFKATEGEGWVDSTFDERMNVLDMASGIPVGAYHYYLSLADPEKQAIHFLDTLRPHIEQETVSFLACDYEESRNPANPDAGVEEDKLYAFLSMVQAGAGVRTLVYTNVKSWHSRLVNIRNRWRGPAWATRFPLWVANWEAATPKLPRPWTDWAIWQYRVARDITPGTTGRIDQDMFNGDARALRLYFGLEEAPPAGELDYDLLAERVAERLAIRVIE